MMAMFLRLGDAQDKETELTSEVQSLSTRTFVVDIDRFKELPGSPFAYWASAEARNLFLHYATAEADGRRFTKGLCTTDGTRFVRVWWEPRSDSKGNTPTKWVNFANGSRWQKFYF